MSNPQAKFQPWTVIVGGVQKVISVLATDIPDNLSGATGYQGTYSNDKAYAQGAIVRVETVLTVEAVHTTVGVFGCVQAVPANGTGNQVPQWPEPLSNVFWHLLNFGPKAISACQNGTKNIYINASDPF